jgi:uncharacterized protein YjbJ (UPF0337 family)
MTILSIMSIMSTTFLDALAFSEHGRRAVRSTTDRTASAGLSDALLPQFPTIASRARCDSDCWLNLFRRRANGSPWRIGTAASRVGRILSTLYWRIHLMGINKDQVDGRVKEAAGKVQEVAGKAVGSATQQAKGLANQVGGATQAGFGDAKENLKETLKDSQRQRE